MYGLVAVGHALVFRLTGVGAFRVRAVAFAWRGQSMYVYRNAARPAPPPLAAGPALRNGRGIGETLMWLVALLVVAAAALVAWTRA